MPADPTRPALPRAAALALLAPLAACSDDPKDSSLTAGDSPTWADVSPIFAESCVGCHHAGGVGPGDFTTWAGASPKASVIGAFVEGGIMPPPSMDPGCRPYVGHDRMTLTAEESDQITAWVAAGAAEGDPVDPLVPPTLTLAGADIEAILPVTHLVTPQEDQNEYHCQILDNPFNSSTYITGFDALIDQPSVVHHLVLAIDRGGDAGQDSADGDLSDGWDCRTPIVEPDWDILHAWAPGMEPTAFDEGLGIAAGPGDQLVLQVHYFGDDEAAGTPDQSGYRFRTADSVDTEMLMQQVGPTGFTLQTGVQTVEETLDQDYPVDVTLHGVVPHMHTLGQGYRSEILDGATTCLAAADTWDFGHQAAYLFEEPVVWRRGTQVRNSCTYDNDTGAPVGFGEGTDQEMCFFLYYYSY